MVGEEEEEAAFRKYCEEGMARALALGNRGPLRFEPDGRLAKDILEAYREHGFYVFEGVVSGEELEDCKAEIEVMLANAPSAKGSPADKRGRPVKYPTGWYHFVKPLSDPMGGGKKYANNYPVSMRQPKPKPGSPELVNGTIDHALVILDSGLRITGHPGILLMAEAILGSDFLPYSENMFLKPARLGASTAWHHDVFAGWDEDWKAGRLSPGNCGVNCHFSYHRCTPANGLWVLPGSHKHGRIDIKALSERSGGTARLQEAIPLFCEPGDLYIQDRMILHGAFANTSDEGRVSLQFGFLPRAPVLNKQVPGYWRNGIQLYDAEYIHERSKMVQLAIDARRQKYHQEVPYEYLPFKGREDECRWNPKLKEDYYGEYWLRDMESVPPGDPPGLKKKKKSSEA